MDDQDINFSSPALVYTLFIYGGLLLVCYFTYLSIPYTQTQIDQGGVEVNYGNTDKGMGNDQTSTENPSAKPKPSTKSYTKEAVQAPQKTLVQDHSPEKDLVTQRNEESEALRTHAPIRRLKPAVRLNQNALYKGPASSGRSSGDGNTTETGNQGQPGGSVVSKNYGGNGTGGGGISLNLQGRKFTSRPTLEDEGQSEGKVTVLITVDREGTIVSAEAGARGSTIQNEALWKKCEAAVLEAKLNAITGGPEIQSGKVIFSFRLL